jgi:hypothetical protein
MKPRRHITARLTLVSALAALLLWPAAASAEIRLFLTRIVVNEQLVSSQSTLQGSVVTLPEVRRRDFTELTFDLRNLGNADIGISNLRVIPKTDVCGSEGGNAFPWESSSTNPPGLLRPNNSYSFKLQYHPPKAQCYEAYLVAAQQTWILRGVVLERTVMFEIDTAGQRQIINGSPSDFGNVSIGEAYIKSYRIENNTGQTVTIDPASISDQSGSYTLLNAPQGPRTVTENDPYEFNVRFSPTRTGLIPARLSVDQRVINLIGEGLEGVIPNFTLQVPSGTLSSNTQAELRVQLASPAATALTGNLELRFEPDDTKFPDDAAVRFLDVPGRQLAFQVTAGSTNATFGGSGSEVARFSTGTAAGKIRLIATLGPWTQSALLDVLADAPRLTDGNLQRNAGSLALRVSGFDNTRSANSVEFRFFGLNGVPLGEPSSMVVPVSDLFSAFFGNSSQGGQFALNAQFPVDGDASAIRRVEVILRNRLGPSLVRILE